MFLTHRDCRDALTFADLVHLPLVFRKCGSKTRQKLEEAAKKASVPPDARARDCGLWRRHRVRFRLIQLEGPAFEMDEALICLRERSRGKLVAAFMELAAESKV